MIQTGINLKRIADFTKEYLSVIIILPAVFGGLWQLFELLTIAPPFIRFFSISQIVPDGLFILFLFLYCAMPLLVGHLANAITLHSGKTTYELLTTPVVARKKQKIRIFGSLFLIIWLFGCVFFYYAAFVNLKAVQIDWGIMIAITIVLLCNLYLNNCFNAAISEDKQFYKYGNLLLLFLYILITFFIFKKVHINQFPNMNVENIESVISDVDKKYPNSKNEILYYNDKFIFFKLTDKHQPVKDPKKYNGKIYIVELEKLFNN